MRFVVVTGMSGGGKSTALKMLEDIDTTTGLISNFHIQTPFVNDKNPLTELPHNLTKELKQFLVYGLEVPLICA